MSTIDEPLQMTRVNNTMKDERVKQHNEFTESKMSFLHFCETAMSLVTQSGDLIPFVPYRKQHMLLALLETRRNIITKHTRQAGVSQAFRAYILWKSIFDSNSRIVVVSDRYTTACNWINTLVTEFESLSESIKQFRKIINTSAEKVMFDNGSTVQIISADVEFTNICTADLLYIDNLAFMRAERQEQIFKNLIPRLNKRGQLLISSIPNKYNDTFAELWHDAGHSELDLIRFETSWWDVPGRSADFKEQLIKEKGRLTFAREYEGVFLTS